MKQIYWASQNPKTMTYICSNLSFSLHWWWEYLLWTVVSAVFFLLVTSMPDINILPVSTSNVLASFFLLLGCGAGFTDETPRDYHCNLGPDGRRRDADERPELCRGTVEFVASKEYMVSAMCFLDLDLARD